LDLLIRRECDGHCFGSLFRLFILFPNSIRYGGMSVDYVGFTIQIRPLYFWSAFYRFCFPHTHLDYQILYIFQLGISPISFLLFSVSYQKSIIWPTSERYWYVGFCSNWVSFCLLSRATILLCPLGKQSLMSFDSANIDVR